MRGFSLLEVVVAMGIFSLMMVVASEGFGSGVLGYKNNMRAEQDLENAQFIMNDMMKQLRTSTVVNPVGNPVASTSIRFFDHSQSKCLEYRLQAGSPNNYVEKAIGTAAAVDELSCGSDSMGTWTRVTTGDVTMNLSIISSSNSPKRVGLVTIVFVVKGRISSPVQPITLQSSVSLRDYTYVGI